MMTDKELHEHHRKMVKSLSPDKREMCIKVLKEHLDGDWWESIREAYVDDPDGWMIEQHFFAGMGIRNLLRHYGCGEKELGIENLDDYYIGLLEVAAGVETV